MGKKYKTLYTIWVMDNATEKLIKRTRISFSDKNEAKHYKAYLNDNLHEDNITDYRYVVLTEESVVYKHATDLIKTPDELTLLGE